MAFLFHRARYICISSTDAITNTVTNIITNIITKMTIITLPTRGFQRYMQRCQGSIEFTHYTHGRISLEFPPVGEKLECQFRVSNDVPYVALAKQPTLCHIDAACPHGSWNSWVCEHQWMHHEYVVCMHVYIRTCTSKALPWCCAALHVYVCMCCVISRTLKASLSCSSYECKHIHGKTCRCTHIHVCIRACTHTRTHLYMTAQ